MGNRVRKSKRVRRVHFGDGHVWEYHIVAGIVKIFSPLGHPQFPPNKQLTWRVPFQLIDPDTQQAIDYEEEAYEEAAARGYEWWPDSRDGGGSPWRITPRAVKEYIQENILA